MRRNAYDRNPFLKHRGLPSLAYVFVALLWILLVLYPRPEALFLSVHRLYQPPLNTRAVAHLDPLVEGKSPREIETLVNNMLPYAPNWETHRMPWYYPSTREVLENPSADCKGRFILLASLFERHDIAYESRISPVHVWITYEGKSETTLENERAHFMGKDEQQRRLLQVPEIDWNELWHHMRTSFVRPMPYSRLMLLYFTPLVTAWFMAAWEKAWRLSDPGTLESTAIPKTVFAPGALILRPQQP